MKFAIMFGGPNSSGVRLAAWLKCALINVWVDHELFSPGTMNSDQNMNT